MEQLQKRKSFSVEISEPKYQNLIAKTIQDKLVRNNVVSNIITIVSANPSLQKCETGSILSCAFQANSLQLSLSPTLGYAYVIPYGTKAQFQIGWKGLVQLAMRSGHYKSIGVEVVREHEFKGFSAWKEPIIDMSREDLTQPIVGYFAYFKLVSGGEKCIYWSKEKCEAHAHLYSKSYGNGSSTDKWTHQFDEMALKTVLKQLLSKWGLSSVELTAAISYDQAVIEDNGTPNYLDNAQETPKEKETTSSTTIKNKIEIQEENSYDSTEDNGEVF